MNIKRNCFQWGFILNLTFVLFSFFSQRYVELDRPSNDVFVPRHYSSSGSGYRHRWRPIWKSFVRDRSLLLRFQHHVSRSSIFQSFGIEFSFRSTAISTVSNGCWFDDNSCAVCLRGCCILSGLSKGLFSRDVVFTSSKQQTYGEQYDKIPTVSYKIWK